MAGSKRIDEVLRVIDSALEAGGPDAAPTRTPTRTPTAAPGPVAAPAARPGWRLRSRRRSLADARFVAPPTPPASGPVRFDERVRTAAELASGRSPASPLAEAG